MSCTNSTQRSSTLRSTLVALWSGVLLCAPVSVTGQNHAATTNASSGLKVGISTHFAQGQGDPSTYIPTMKRNGWVALRDEAFWSHTERSPGHFVIPENLQSTLAAAKKNGTSSLILLGYGHPAHTRGFKPTTAEQRAAFTRYAGFVAEQTKGLVDELEIWNEWDIDIGGGLAGRPEDYIALLREVVPVIRRVAPKIKIIGGSVTPEGVDRGYLRALIDLGLLDWVDGISVHAYVWSRAASTPNDAANWLQKLLRYTRGKPLHVTEIGWPTHKAFLRRREGVSESTQRDYVCQTISLFAAIPSIKSVYFYGLLDEGSDDNNPEHRFGLIRQNGEPRPAFALNACAA
jgi:polysaccharide biosynthesis protein PslG